MKILLANDHGGVNLKNEIKEYLILKKHRVINFGVDTIDRVDYPEIATGACQKFLEEKDYDFGIMFCGTGIGLSMAANKILGIRCALIHDVYTAKMARSHNDANFIALGGRVEYKIRPTELVQKFMDTKVENGRHTQRVHKLNQLGMNLIEK